MMKKYYCVALFILLGVVFTQAQAVKITGEVTTPIEIKLTDMPQYAQTEVVRKDKDGKDHTYTGVLLGLILKKAGVTMGKELHGENLAKYVLLEAGDTYKVTFALAELDKDFTDRKIILATTVDGKPLPAGEGPFRIIVQDEKKPARCIRQVIGIKVMFAK